MVKYISMVTHCFLNGSALLQLLLDANQRFDAVDHLLHQLHFGEPNALLVGDVPLAARAGRCVLAVPTARLHAEALGEVFELVRGECIRQQWQEDHRGGAQAGAKVARAGVDLPEVVVELEARPQ